MNGRDIALAVLTAVIWGLAFVATKYGLQSFSAPQLVVLRFVVACLPALFVPRPKIPWLTLIIVGLTLYTGQFLLLFYAYTQGLPPGLASMTQQTQAFFTIGLAALFLGDIPTLRQTAGIGLAICGLAAIALTVGGDLTTSGLALGIASALSWAIGNVLLKKVGSGVAIFPLVAWLCLIPPIPALILSTVYDRSHPLGAAIVGASVSSAAAVLYLGAIATVLAYAIWGRLLARHSTAEVAPFALLAPCTGMLASAIIFHERLGPVRLAGAFLILAGLACIVMPRRLIVLRS